MSCARDVSSTLADSKVPKTGLKSLCNACGLRERKKFRRSRNSFLPSAVTGWSKTQKAPMASGGESGSGSNSPSFSYEEAASPANW